MKKLYLILIFYGTIDGFTQTDSVTTISQRFYPASSTLDGKGLGYSIALHDVGWPCDCSKCNKLDTIPSALLITHKPPSFAHSIEGYCIYKMHICINIHLVYRGKKYIRLKPPYKVWNCSRLNN